MKGNRLYLRFLERKDLDRTWEWLHRPDVYEKIGVKVPFTKEQQERWFESLENDEAKHVLAICIVETDTHIGNVSLDMIDYRHRNARLSIFIADKRVRGKGFGSEAMLLLERYAFESLKLHKIWCKTDAGDPEVLNFYKKLNFNKEGKLKEHEIKNGVFIDKVLFAKLNALQTK